MSQNWGYVCVSHEPHIESEHWFNHGEDILLAVFLLERQGFWPDDKDSPFEGDPMPVNFQSQSVTYPVQWLRAHPKCKIQLGDEYGARQNIPELMEVKYLIGRHETRIQDSQSIIALIEGLLERKHKEQNG